MNHLLNTSRAASSGAASPSTGTARRALGRGAQLCATLLAAAVLAACGGGSSADQVNDFTSGSSGSNSSSSCNANYSDQVGSSTRRNAANDPQCSSYVAYADSYLAAAKSACASGNRSAAEQYYENHIKAADYADSAVATVCGGSGGTTVGGGGGSSTSGQYTLYIKYGRSSSNQGQVLGGQCGNSRPSDDTGYQWVAVATNLTQSQCTSKAAEYGLR